MKRLLFLILSLATFLAGCKSDDNDPEGPVNIRLENISSASYSNIIVNITGDEVTYPNLESGQLSNYKEFTSTYRYAYIWLLANETDTLVFQPIDFVGENLISAGNYTYQVGITENQQYLTISLVEN